MIDNFTICVLLFGDHFKLAERCLGSLTAHGSIPIGHLRIGLNAVSDATRQLAYSLAQGNVWEFTENKHKYPVMREMVHGISPITTPYTMWFDDDSYIAQPLSSWLHDVETQMQSADMLGSIYSIGWQGNQREYVKAQPWYNGRDPSERKKIKFATGGWWTIRSSVLYAHDYPWQSLDHRGGDVMLGEMCFQQQLRLKNFRKGVHINADDDGRESQAKKRGFDQPPIGVDFEPGIGDELHKATGLIPTTQPSRLRIIKL